MLNKLTSVTLVAALVIVLCGASAFANDSSNPDAKTETANVPSGALEKKEVKPNEQLKNNMLKLVADAKAGKVMPAAKSQIRPAKSNNWSTGTKIAVGVGIAVAVVVVILVVKHTRDHLLDGLDGIGGF
jgi:hypothetical protein